MTARGPRNLITDVPGLKVGNALDERARSGVTVVLPDARCVAAVDVRGGAPGTRETDALAPDTLVDQVDAVVLAGGSVYGLAAADGVTAWLGAEGRGFRMTPGAPTAPIVPAAILFDLANGGDMAWGLDPPYRALGLEAVKAAGLDFALGATGAGAGAMAGRLKGGLGSASVVSDDGAVVGAVVAVNSFGSVVAPGGRAFWASPLELDDEFGGVALGKSPEIAQGWGLAKRDAVPRTNTTLAVVATDAVLTSGETRRLAVMAQDGFARAIRPAHAPFDGDVVFALTTGTRPLAEPRAFALTVLGALAADCVARAVARGAYEARAWPGTDVMTWRDLS